jgi:glycosyltransferase involved in cell wall biosynthesis
MTTNNEFGAKSVKTLSSDNSMEPKIGNNKSNVITSQLKFQDLYNCIKNVRTHGNLFPLSIVLPLYNEEKTIKSVLDNLPSNNSVEVIVVNDHSSDNSLNEIKKVQTYKNIQVINHPKNKGYGAAILTGIKHARGEIIVTMDSDGQHSPDDILTLIKPIVNKEADYTIGSRYLGSYFYKLPVSTRLGEVVLEKFIRILFNKNIKNNQNGFRAFNRKVVSIFHNFKYEGYAFCTEQILKASLEGFKIKECPIKVYNRAFGSSHIILRRLAVNIFSCLFIYYLRKIQFMALKRTKAGEVKIIKKPPLTARFSKKPIKYENLIQYNSFFFIERQKFMSI